MTQSTNEVKPREKMKKTLNLIHQDCPISNLSFKYVIQQTSDTPIVTNQIRCLTFIPFLDFTKSPKVS